MNMTTPAAPSAAVAPRIEFLGRYKGLLAVLVVLIHTGITYGASGSWYYTDANDATWLHVIATNLGAVSQSFVLGAFFFLSAYFLPGSLEKKGAGRVLADRLVRLGIPFVVYYFFLNPLLIMAVRSLGDGDPIPWGPYFGSGPLWFVEVLFLFTLIYVGFRAVRRATTPLFLARGIPGKRGIGLYILVAAVLGYLARIVFPSGWSIHNLQLGFFPMYILLFAAGIKAGREEWLRDVAAVRIKLWAPLSVAGVLLFAPIMVAGGALVDVTPFLGGLTWQSAVYATWEAVTGTALFITTLVLFARRRARVGVLGASFGRASFGIYIFHAAVIILGALGLSRLDLHPALKWVILSGGAIGVCWGLTELGRRVPGLRRIL